jgi:hypothetical protein
MSRLIPGLVPIYEEYEAMRFAGYTSKAWRKLESMDRSMCVAHFRYNRLIGQHEQDISISEIERKGKRAG